MKTDSQKPQLRSEERSEEEHGTKSRVEVGGGVPGPITYVPALVDRPETGPMQFGDDWPGVFIRGDNAMSFAVYLDHILKFVSDEEWLTKSVLTGLISTLRSCDARHLRRPA
jgi:hypothetical protein